MYILSLSNLDTCIQLTKAILENISVFLISSIFFDCLLKPCLPLSNQRFPRHRHRHLSGPSQHPHSTALRDRHR
jgi:hypothetical protein